ncbi:hypothetical protein ORI89_11870 [Sphingobacterium sp. UT-1RO-CII-1]|uniref:hypothetical protein n=1 Tax=Sphingobacterium sp. UT-1RO-CII-1 TaxID=2995225 RepID=UPI00227A78E0|nr:hypothetical protein [Sphingobacterium sp. UT-1RO-CII-1]MCY4780351.1 hypothetical protein [Sphingobacterium sp. UT-1RO-CII-1]
MEMIDYICLVDAINSAESIFLCLNDVSRLRKPANLTNEKTASSPSSIGLLLSS